jgi:hypothetical protein
MIPIASDAAQSAVSAAADDVFSGINLPGEAPNAETSNPTSDVSDFSVQAFSEAPEADFVGARMLQDDTSAETPLSETPSPEQTPVASGTATTPPADSQITMLTSLVQQLMDQNKMLMADRAPKFETPPEKSESELLQEQVDALIKQEFPEDDGTVGKFAKLLMGQVSNMRDADRQRLQAENRKLQSTQMEERVSAEANEVASTVINQGYEFKNKQAEQKFTHLIRDLSLVITSLTPGSTPKQHLADIQNVFNEGAYARAKFLGNKAKTIAMGHTQAPRAMNVGAPVANSIPPTGANMNAPISNWEIRQAGYATNADAVFDDYKKVFEMRRRG